MRGRRKSRIDGEFTDRQAPGLKASAQGFQRAANLGDGLAVGPKGDGQGAVSEPGHADARQRRLRIAEQDLETLAGGGPGVSGELFQQFGEFAQVQKVPTRKETA